jgi:MFS family permease
MLTKFNYRISFGTLVGKSYIIPSMWLALWNSMIQVGAMAGALMTGAIADRFGRKSTFVGGAFIAAIGTFDFTLALDVLFIPCFPC